MHSDDVSKSLCQNFFFRASGHWRGENIIFCDNDGYKQRLGPLVPDRRQISHLFSWARILKWGRNREKQRKRRLGISAVTSRFTVRGWNVKNFDRSGKTKQTTNWSVSTFKGKIKFFRFKIVEYETRAFNRKFEIKLIPIKEWTMSRVRPSNSGWTRIVGRARR